MITRVLLRKNTVDKDFIKNLADVFYKDASVDGRTFSANKRTGLNYFGEYLERHEDRGISIIEIMAAVCFRNSEELPEQQIFDGQYEMFVERIEQKRRELDFDFELEILYAMFLIKMKKEKYGKEVLKDILSKMNLDNNFLVLCGLVRDKYILLDKECIDIVVQKLKNNKLSINIDSLMYDIKDKNHRLKFDSEHECLKYIISILDLKKSNFKDTPSVFENLKYLKKVGTRDSVYKKAKEILDIKEDEFYLLSIKIAADSYADGSALVKTNEYLIEKLEETLTVNNDWYCELPYLKLRVRGGLDDGKISLSKIDFSNIEEKYFGSVIKAYNCGYSGLSYSQLEEVCRRENFINYMTSKKDSLNYAEKHFVMGVIENEKDKSLVKTYYGIVKDYDDLKNSDICVFCRAKLVSSDYILDKIFKTGEKGLSIEYSSRDIINSCRQAELTDVLIKIVEKLNSNNVSLGLYVDGALGYVSSYLGKKVNSDELDESSKKELIRLLNDFNFLYFSESYHEFLIGHIENEFFKEALDIDDEELRNIAKYLLEQNYISSNQRNALKKIVLSKEDIFKENLKSKVDNYMLRYVNLCGRMEVDYNLVDLIENCENKDIVVNYLKQTISDIGFDYKRDIEFMAIIRLVMRTRLLDEEELMDIIKNRLFVSVL